MQVSGPSLGQLPSMGDIQYVYQQVDTKTKQTDLPLAVKYQGSQPGADRLPTRPGQHFIYWDLLNPKYPIAQNWE